MPIGMFLITHHDIKGPEIKQSYFTKNIEFTQDIGGRIHE